MHVLDDRVQRRVAATNAPLSDHPRRDAMCRLVVDSEQRSVSIGCVLASPGEQIRALLARADEAMYAHKARAKSAVA